MTEKEKMLAGELYMASDPKLTAERQRARSITRLYNSTSEDEQDCRNRLIRQLFGKVGNNVYVESTFRCDYGYNIKVGDNFYANFDCIILDVREVNIGNNVFLAPGVNIYTATHPLEAKIRESLMEYGKPVNIGNNVWVGGGAIILPGVTIGDNAVIGAGSVITKDVPPGVVVAGNPCRVLRKI